LYRARARAYLILQVAGSITLAVLSSTLIQPTGILGVGWANIGAKLVSLALGPLMLRREPQITIRPRWILAAGAGGTLGVALTFCPTYGAIISMIIGMVWMWRGGLLSKVLSRLIPAKPR